MRKIIAICLYVCLLAFNSAGQQVQQNKWYTLSRNRIIEFTITTDSIVSRQLDWNLTPRINSRNYRSAKPIKNLMVVDGNIYSVYKNNKSDSSFGSVLSLVRSKSFPKLYFLNSDSTHSSHGLVLQDFIRNNPKEKFGIFLLSKSYLNKLKAQKSIDQMTAEDLKKYIARSAEVIKRLDSLETINIRSERLYGGYFMTRYVFGEIGFNPLYSDKQYEAMIRKFETRDDTKEMLEKFFE